MNRIVALLYGVFSYFVFFITFLYAVGFVGNFGVPKAIDSDVTSSVGLALIIDLFLLSIFALQHSVMARPAFKKWWTQFVPVAVERSTYVILSSVALIILFKYWQPIDGVVWSVGNPMAQKVLWALFGLGWLIVLTSTYLINHFDLFGLRQVYLYYKEKEYTDIGFRTPFLYKFVRHPIMLGFIIAFWATPQMSMGHLLFSVVTTLYILIAIQFEEHDLVTYYGDAYRSYKEKVSMIIPFMTHK